MKTDKAIKIVKGNKEIVDNTNSNQINQLKKNNPYDMSFGNKTRIKLEKKLAKIFSDLANKAIEESYYEINKFKNPSFLLMVNEYERLSGSNLENKKRQLEVLENYISNQVDVFNQLILKFQELQINSMEMNARVQQNEIKYNIELILKQK